LSKSSIYKDVQKLNLVTPDYKKWPIYNIFENRDDFVQEVAWQAIDEIFKRNSIADIKEQLASAYYLEKIRIKTDPYKVDLDDENEFWKSVKIRMTDLMVGNVENEKNEIKTVVEDIVKRYAEEITGDFKISTYRFAQGMVPVILRRVLNSARAKYIKKFYSNKYLLSDKIHYTGHIDLIRQLATKATIIFVPTHFSNLDNILIGWAIESIGIPPVIYGAGLNLFNSRILGYYMSRLGAYKLDRRKKNDIYLETLKTYSRISIEKGCHYLFYPGGTRSRSGMLESRFKLGLLGTAVDAQFENCKKNETDYKKVILVPTVINYHFVLEAKQLIEQHLKSEGKEKYFLNNEADIKGASTVLNLMWKFFSTESESAISFGQPMDIFGNKVNALGESHDKQARVIDISNYFRKDNELVEDDQRNSVYTKMLSDQLLKEYRKSSVVFTSHIVAYTVYELIKKMHPKLDLYNLLRLPSDDRIIAKDTFIKNLENAIQFLKSKADEGSILLDPKLHNSTEDIIEHALSNLGIYHKERVVYQTKQGDFTSENMNLLYYYHNRLYGFGIQYHIS